MPRERQLTNRRENPRACRGAQALSHHTPDHDRGHKRPPVLVGDPVLRHNQTARRFGADHQFPEPGLLGQRRTPDDDLFHEPEAQPETVATGAPPKATVSDRHPSSGDTSSGIGRQRCSAGQGDPITFSMTWPSLMPCVASGIRRQRPLIKPDPVVTCRLSAVPIVERPAEHVTDDYRGF